MAVIHVNRLGKECEYKDSIGSVNTDQFPGKPWDDCTNAEKRWIIDRDRSSAVREGEDIIEEANEEAGRRLDSLDRGFDGR